MGNEDFNIQVYKEENNFHWYNNIYLNENYENVHNKVLRYFQNINISEDKENIENQILQLDEQIINLIKQKAQLQEEINCIDIAESISDKNNLISNYINTLKNNNKLNRWYQIDDWRIYDIIENGTYKLSIWHYKDADKSWRTGKIQYEVGYTFSINSILQDTTIKSVSKKVDSKEDMINYIEGRKKAFENYFQEEKPAIIDEYKHIVNIKGVRLEGYKLESELK